MIQMSLELGIPRQSYLIKEAYVKEHEETTYLHRHHPQ